MFLPSSVIEAIKKQADNGQKSAKSLLDKINGNDNRQEERRTAPLGDLPNVLGVNTTDKGPVDDWWNKKEDETKKPVDDWWNNTDDTQKTSDELKRAAEQLVDTVNKVEQPVTITSPKDGSTLTVTKRAADTIKSIQDSKITQEPQDELDLRDARKYPDAKYNVQIVDASNVDDIQDNIQVISVVDGKGFHTNIAASGLYTIGRDSLVGAIEDANYVLYNSNTGMIYQVEQNEQLTKATDRANRYRENALKYEQSTQQKLADIQYQFNIVQSEFDDACKKFGITDYASHDWTTAELATVQPLLDEITLLNAQADEVYKHGSSLTSIYEKKASKIENSIGNSTMDISDYIGYTGIVQKYADMQKFFAGDMNEYVFKEKYGYVPDAESLQYAAQDAFDAQTLLNMCDGTLYDRGGTLTAQYTARSNEYINADSAAKNAVKYASDKLILNMDDPKQINSVVDIVRDAVVADMDGVKGGKKALRIAKDIAEFLDINYREIKKGDETEILKDGLDAIGTDQLGNVSTGLTGVLLNQMQDFGDLMTSWFAAARLSTGLGGARVLGYDAKGNKTYTVTSVKEDELANKEYYYAKADRRDGLMGLDRMKADFKNYLVASEAILRGDVRPTTDTFSSNSTTETYTLQNNCAVVDTYFDEHPFQGMVLDVGLNMLVDPTTWISMSATASAKDVKAAALDIADPYADDVVKTAAEYLDIDPDSLSDLKSVIKNNYADNIVNTAKKGEATLDQSAVARSVDKIISSQEVYEKYFKPLANDVLKKDLRQELTDGIIDYAKNSIEVVTNNASPELRKMWEDVNTIAAKSNKIEQLDHTLNTLQLGVVGVGGQALKPAIKSARTALNSIEASTNIGKRVAVAKNQILYSLSKVFGVDDLENVDIITHAQTGSAIDNIISDAVRAGEDIPQNAIDELLQCSVDTRATVAKAIINDSVNTIYDNLYKSLTDKSIGNCIFTFNTKGRSTADIVNFLKGAGRCDIDRLDAVCKTTIGKSYNEYVDYIKRIANSFDGTPADYLGNRLCWSKYNVSSTINDNLKRIERLSTNYNNRYMRMQVSALYAAAYEHTDEAIEALLDLDVSRSAPDLQEAYQNLVDTLLENKNIKVRNEAVAENNARILKHNKSVKDWNLAVAEWNEDVDFDNNLIKSKNIEVDLYNSDVRLHNEYVRNWNKMIYSKIKRTEEAYAGFKHNNAIKEWNAGVYDAMRERADEILEHNAKVKLANEEIADYNSYVVEHSNRIKAWNEAAKEWNFNMRELYDADVAEYNRVLEAENKTKEHILTFKNTFEGRVKGAVEFTGEVYIPAVNPMQHDTVYATPADIINEAFKQYGISPSNEQISDAIDKCFKSSIKEFGDEKFFEHYYTLKESSFANLNGILDNDYIDQLILDDKFISACERNGVANLIPDKGMRDASRVFRDVVSGSGANVGSDYYKIMDVFAGSSSYLNEQTARYLAACNDRDRSTVLKRCVDYIINRADNNFKLANDMFDTRLAVEEALKCAFGCLNDNSKGIVVTRDYTYAAFAQLIDTFKNDADYGGIVQNALDFGKYTTNNAELGLVLNTDELNRIVANAIDPNEVIYTGYWTQNGINKPVTFEQFNWFLQHPDYKPAEASEYLGTYTSYNGKWTNQSNSRVYQWKQKYMNTVRKQEYYTDKAGKVLKGTPAKSTQIIPTNDSAFYKLTAGDALSDVEFKSITKELDSIVYKNSESTVNSNLLKWRNSINNSKYTFTSAERVELSELLKVDCADIPDKDLRKLIYTATTNPTDIPNDTARLASSLKYKLEHKQLDEITYDELEMLDDYLHADDAGNTTNYTSTAYKNLPEGVHNQYDNPYGKRGPVETIATKHERPEYTGSKVKIVEGPEDLSIDKTYTHFGSKNVQSAGEADTTKHAVYRYDAGKTVQQNHRGEKIQFDIMAAIKDLVMDENKSFGLRKTIDYDNCLKYFNADYIKQYADSDELLSAVSYYTKAVDEVQLHGAEVSADMCEQVRKVINAECAGVSDINTVRYLDYYNNISFDDPVKASKATVHAIESLNINPELFDKLDMPSMSDYDFMGYSKDYLKMRTDWQEYIKFADDAEYTNLKSLLSDDYVKYNKSLITTGDEQYDIEMLKEMYSDDYKDFQRYQKKRTDYQKGSSDYEKFGTFEKYKRADIPKEWSFNRDKAIRIEKGKRQELPEKHVLLDTEPFSDFREYLQVKGRLMENAHMADTVADKRAWLDTRRYLLDINHSDNPAYRAHFEAQAEYYKRVDDVYSSFNKESFFYTGKEKYNILHSQIKQSKEVELNLWNSNIKRVTNLSNDELKSVLLNGGMNGIVVDPSKSELALWIAKKEADGFVVTHTQFGGKHVAIVSVDVQNMDAATREFYRNAQVATTNVTKEAIAQSTDSIALKYADMGDISERINNAFALNNDTLGYHWANSACGSRNQMDFYDELQSKLPTQCRLDTTYRRAASQGYMNNMLVDIQDARNMGAYKGNLIGSWFSSAVGAGETNDAVADLYRCMNVDGNTLRAQMAEIGLDINNKADYKTITETLGKTNHLIILDETMHVGEAQKLRIRTLDGITDYAKLGDAIVVDDAVYRYLMGEVKGTNRAAQYLTNPKAIQAVMDVAKDVRSAYITGMLYAANIAGTGIRNIIDSSTKALAELGLNKKYMKQYVNMVKDQQTYVQMMADVYDETGSRSIEALYQYISAHPEIDGAQLIKWNTAFTLTGTADDSLEAIYGEINNKRLLDSLGINVNNKDIDTIYNVFTDIRDKHWLTNKFKNDSEMFDTVYAELNKALIDSTIDPDTIRDIANHYADWSWGAPERWYSKMFDDSTKLGRVLSLINKRTFDNAEVRVRNAMLLTMMDEGQDELAANMRVIKTQFDYSTRMGMQGAWDTVMPFAKYQFSNAAYWLDTFNYSSYTGANMRRLSELTGYGNNAIAGFQQEFAYNYMVAQSNNDYKKDNMNDVYDMRPKMNTVELLAQAFEDTIEDYKGVPQKYINGVDISDNRYLKIGNGFMDTMDWLGTIVSAPYELKEGKMPSLIEDTFFSPVKTLVKYNEPITEFFKNGFDATFSYDRYQDKYFGGDQAEKTVLYDMAGLIPVYGNLFNTTMTAAKNIRANEKLFGLAMQQEQCRKSLFQSCGDYAKAIGLGVFNSVVGLKYDNEKKPVFVPYTDSEGNRITWGKLTAEEKAKYQYNDLCSVDRQWEITPSAMLGLKGRLARFGLSKKDIYMLTKNINWTNESFYTTTDGKRYINKDMMEAVTLDMLEQGYTVDEIAYLMSTEDGWYDLASHQLIAGDTSLQSELMNSAFLMGYNALPNYIKYNKDMYTELMHRYKAIGMDTQAAWRAILLDRPYIAEDGELCYLTPEQAYDYEHYVTKYPILTYFRLMTNSLDESFIRAEDFDNYLKWYDKLPDATQYETGAYSRTYAYLKQMFSSDEANQMIMNGAYLTVDGRLINCNDKDVADTYGDKYRPWQDSKGNWHKATTRGWTTQAWRDAEGYWHKAGKYQNILDYDDGKFHAWQNSKGEWRKASTRGYVNQPWKDANGVWHKAGKYENHLPEQKAYHAWQNSKGWWLKGSTRGYVNQPWKDANGYWHKAGKYENHLEDRSGRFQAWQNSKGEWRKAHTRGWINQPWRDANGYWHKAGKYENKLPERKSSGAFQDANGYWHKAGDFQDKDGYWYHKGDIPYLGRESFQAYYNELPDYTKYTKGVFSTTNKVMKEAGIDYNTRMQAMLDGAIAIKVDPNSETYQQLLAQQKIVAVTETVYVEKQVPLRECSWINNEWVWNGPQSVKVTDLGNGYTVTETNKKLMNYASSLGLANKDKISSYDAAYVTVKVPKTVVTMKADDGQIFGRLITDGNGDVWYIGKAPAYQRPIRRTNSYHGGKGGARQSKKFARKMLRKYRKQYCYDKFKKLKGTNWGMYKNPMHISYSNVRTYSKQHFLQQQSTGYNYWMRWGDGNVTNHRNRNGRLTLAPSTYRNPRCRTRNMYKELYGKYGASRMRQRQNIAGYSNMSVTKMRRNDVQNRAYNIKVSHARV